MQPFNSQVGLYSFFFIPYVYFKQYLRDLFLFSSDCRCLFWKHSLTVKLLTIRFRLLHRSWWRRTSCQCSWWGWACWKFYFWLILNFNFCHRLSLLRSSEHRTCWWRFYSARWKTSSCLGWLLLRYFLYFNTRFWCHLSSSHRTCSYLWTSA